MEILIFAARIAALALVVYGGVLCLWHRATERPGVRRTQVYRGRRNMRLISEIARRRAREPEPNQLLGAEAIVGLKKAA